MKKIILMMLLVAPGAGCKKKVPPPVSVPVPKAQVEGSLLNAPGNYIRNTVGQADKAKAAKTLFEDTAKKRVQSLELNETSGK